MCRAIALELRDAPQPMIVEFEPFDAWLLAGMLQLCLTHPELPDHSRAYALGLVATLRFFFDAMGCTNTVAAIDKQKEPRQ